MKTDLSNILPEGTDLKRICDGKPRVIISSCLLGQTVRYDGGHKLLPTIGQFLSPWLEIVGHCPEVAAGLGTPRPPIQLIQTERGLTVRQVSPPYTDVTDVLRQANMDWQQRQHRSPVAAILKARSPSCGTGSSPLHNDRGEELPDMGSGIFSAHLQQHFPDALILDESSVASRVQCQKLIVGCYLQQAANHGQPVADSLKQHLKWQDATGLQGFFKA